MGALDQLPAANGQDGILERVRSNPRWAIAIAMAAVLLIAWLAWAIYVASSHGATAGIGVLLVWPAILVGLALISLPFIGGYLLIRRLSDGDGSTAGAEASGEEEGSEEEDQEQGSEEEGSEAENQEQGSEEGTKEEGTEEEGTEEGTEEEPEDEESDEEEEGSEEAGDEKAEEAEAEKASD